MVFTLLLNCLWKESFINNLVSELFDFIVFFLKSTFWVGVISPKIVYINFANFRSPSLDYFKCNATHFLRNWIGTFILVLVILPSNIYKIQISFCCMLLSMTYGYWVPTTLSTSCGDTYIFFYLISHCTCRKQPKL